MSLQKKSIYLLEQVQKILDSYSNKITLRQLYYQLVARQIIPNHQSQYAKLSRLCVIGRDEGILNEEDFADRLRMLDKPASWQSLSSFMDTVKRSYRRDKWQNQERYIEIWTEKDALRSVITLVTHSYGVPLLVVRGQVSRTAIYEAYRRYEDRINEGKECRLYYFGDYDPSGIGIFRSLVERLRNHNDGMGEKIEFYRPALTREQIAEHRLPSDPAKKTDPNYKRFVKEHGDISVELDSLPPEILTELIESCVEANIEPVIFEHDRKIEENEIERLQNIGGAL
ncbi:MAG TPA: hypothetical protein DDY17_06640 [Syntrophaceae bacterium]|jgi:hypothetical protein|nr:hypothetical protein [Syntrophaceae bacterium]